MRGTDKVESPSGSPRFGFVFGLMLLVTLEVVDTTVVNIILPHLKGSLEPLQIKSRGVFLHIWWQQRLLCH